MLCDFYETVNGTYDIRGTYAFFISYSKISNIQGISLKQNLYENDIYAYHSYKILNKTSR